MTYGQTAGGRATPSTFGPGYSPGIFGGSARGSQEGWVPKWLVKYVEYEDGVTRVLSVKLIGFVKTFERDGFIGKHGFDSSQDETQNCATCFVYSDGRKGGKPKIEGVDEKPQFSTNWVQYPAGFKSYFDAEFKTLLINPINPESYDLLLFALSQSPQYQAGFMRGYNHGYEYWDHTLNNFMNALAIVLSRLDEGSPDDDLLGYYTGFATGMRDQKNWYPNLLSPKD